jgi:WD40 repeat protein
VAIVHDIAENRQRIFAANDAARVVALALHPDDEVVASCHVSAGHAALHFWEWGQVGSEQQLKAPPLDLGTLARKHGMARITDCRAMVFSKFGGSLLLLLEHAADGGEQGKGQGKGGWQGGKDVSVLSVEWRKPLVYAYIAHKVIPHAQPAAMACNALGDGAIVIAGQGRLSRVDVGSRGELGGSDVPFTGCGARDVLLCVQFIGDTVVAAGSADGALWLCDAGKASVLCKLNNVHEGALWDIAVDSVRLVTVGADSMVREWFVDQDEVLAAVGTGGGAVVEENVGGKVLPQENLLQTVDMTYHVFHGMAALQAQEISFGPLPLRQWKVGEPGVAGEGVVELRCVCVLPPAEQGNVGKQEESGGLVVATRSCEMFVVSGGIPPTVTILQTAHCSDMGAERGVVTAMCCHPTLPHFATAGSDGTVRLWSAETRRMLMARVAYSVVEVQEQRGHAKGRGGHHTKGDQKGSGVGAGGPRADDIGKGGKGGKVDDKKTKGDDKKANKKGEHGEQVPLKEYSQRAPTTLSFSDDGKRIAVGFECGSVGILDSETLEEIKPLTPPGVGSQAGVRQIVFLPDGHAVAVQRGAQWYMHDVDNLTCSCLMAADPGVNDECSVSRDHGLACIAGVQLCGDVGIGLSWGEGGDVDEFEKGELVFGHAQQVICVAWLAGGSRVISIAGSDCCVLQWQVRGDIEGSKKGAAAKRKLEKASKNVTDKSKVNEVQQADRAIGTPKQTHKHKHAHTRVTRVTSRPPSLLAPSLQMDGEWLEAKGDPYDSYKLFGKKSNKGAAGTAPADLDSAEKMTAAANSYIATRDRREAELSQRHGWSDPKDKAGDDDESDGLPSKDGSVRSSIQSSDKVPQDSVPLPTRLTAAQSPHVPTRLTAAPHVPQDSKGRGKRKGGSSDGERFAVCKSTVFADPRWKDKVGHHQAPENKLELEWVNGYHGHDAYIWLTDPDKGELTSEAGRSNLAFVADANGAVDGSLIAFFVSAVGVVMDTEARRQFFFMAHDAEISAMCVNPARSLVATGQCASHGSLLPPIYVWDPSVVVANSADQTVAGRAREKKSDVVQKLVGFCEQRITVIAFSASGEYVMAIGQDAVHRFACYNLQSGVILFSGMAGNSDIMMMTGTQHGFASAGNKEIKIWEHASLGSKSSSSNDGDRWMAGLAPPNVGPVLVECIVAIDDDKSYAGSSVVCGYPDGKLVIFAQDEEKFEWVLEHMHSRWFQAHKFAITCVAYSGVGDEFCAVQGCHAGILFSGDDHGEIKAWKIASNNGSVKPKEAEPWQQLKTLSFSMLDYHDAVHPRGKQPKPAGLVVWELAIPADPLATTPAHTPGLGHHPHTTPALDNLYTCAVQGWMIQMRWSTCPRIQ